MPVRKEKRRNALCCILRTGCVCWNLYHYKDRCEQIFWSFCCASASVRTRLSRAELSAGNDSHNNQQTEHSILRGKKGKAEMRLILGLLKEADEDNG